MAGEHRHGRQKGISGGMMPKDPKRLARTFRTIEVVEGGILAREGDLAVGVTVWAEGAGLEEGEGLCHLRGVEEDRVGGGGVRSGAVRKLVALHVSLLLV